MFRRLHTMKAKRRNSRNFSCVAKYHWNVREEHWQVFCNLQHILKEHFGVTNTSVVHKQHPILICYQRFAKQQTSLRNPQFSSKECHPFFVGVRIFDNEHNIPIFKKQSISSTLSSLGTKLHLIQKDACCVWFPFSCNCHQHIICIFRRLKTIMMTAFALQKEDETYICLSFSVTMSFWASEMPSFLCLLHNFFGGRGRHLAYANLSWLTRCPWQTSGLWREEDCLSSNFFEKIVVGSWKERQISDGKAWTVHRETENRDIYPSVSVSKNLSVLIIGFPHWKGRTLFGVLLCSSFKSVKDQLTYGSRFDRSWKEGKENDDKQVAWTV